MQAGIGIPGVAEFFQPAGDVDDVFDEGGQRLYFAERSREVLEVDEDDMIGARRGHERLPVLLGILPAETVDELYAQHDDIGLHIGELRDRAPTSHVLFDVVTNSPTVGSALARLCRYHDVMASTVQPRLESLGEETAVGLRAVVPADRWQWLGLPLHQNPRYRLYPVLDQPQRTQRYPLGR